MGGTEHKGAHGAEAEKSSDVESRFDRIWVESHERVLSGGFEGDSLERLDSLINGEVDRPNRIQNRMRRQHLIGEFDST